MKAKTLLKNESKWTQYHNALNKKGEIVNADDKTAVKWDIYGALEKCYPFTAQDPQGKAYHTAVWKVKAVLEKRGLAPHIIGFNDTATFEEVQKLLRDADV